MDEKKLQQALSIILIALIIVWVFQISLYVILSSNADEVSCNLLWCEIKQQRTTIESRITRECFKDNVRVNCSDGNFDWKEEDGTVDCNEYDCSQIIDYIKKHQNLGD